MASEAAAAQDTAAETEATRQASAEVAIVVRGLVKNYGETRAVRGVDLEVRKGEIFGLIGPDGAGKTSTFHILGGIMSATEGTAEMFGTSAREARPFVGYLTQAFSLYQDLTVDENILYMGQLRRVASRDIRERGDRYLSMFGMDSFKQRLAGKLSGGMKQKLALACALVAEPRILLLDEPTTGVDPVSRREFWDTLAQLAADGTTIVVATPYLDEAERCGRVALMHEGAIHQTGTPTELRESLNLKRLELHASDLGKAEQALLGFEHVEDVQRFGDRLDVMVGDPEEGERAVREHLGSQGIEVTEIRQNSPTLENTFVSILRHMGAEREIPAFPSRTERGGRRDEIAIGARGLNKTFGSFQAVKDVNVEIKYGEIFGLLGANGAGKTTTIKMLCGLVGATSGDMTLAGETGSLRSPKVRQQIGYMSQKFSLYDDLTIDENLDFFAGVYGVPADQRRERKEWVVKFAGLDGRENQLTGSLPGGWKQRVAFGSAIMHEPRVLFLDEPTSGVDPIARRDFWRMINWLADQGTAILVTTHYLEEAEQCNRLAFMVAGEIAAEGTPRGVKQEQGGHLLELFTSHPQRALNLLKGEMDRWRVSLFGERLHVIVDEEPDAAMNSLKERLESEQITVRDMREESYSLEDVFIVVVEKSRQQGKVGKED
ncbi:MAG: ABC transporter ATP-binding protein [Bryobacteraceae bacterium]|nr:ABC transporter ATP-binding protein [Bryobacteraceae bacterium]